MSAVYKRIQISIRKSTKQHRENFELHVRTFFPNMFGLLSGREPFAFVSHSHSEAWIAEYQRVLPMTNEFLFPLCQHKSTFLKDFIRLVKNLNLWAVFLFCLFVCLFLLFLL